MNKKLIYDALKPFMPRKRFSANQVKGLDFLLDSYEKQDALNLEQYGYFLATTMVETWFTFQPIEENIRGNKQKYTKPAKNGKVYKGRGYVMITWLTNYAKLGKALGIDLVNYPEKALEPDTALRIALVGMAAGLFTGVRISQYINLEKQDLVNARKVINSLDRAEEIASYAEVIIKALKDATRTHP